MLRIHPASCERNGTFSYHRTCHLSYSSNQLVAWLYPSVIPITYARWTERQNSIETKRNYISTTVTQRNAIDSVEWWWMIYCVHSINGKQLFSSLLDANDTLVLFRALDIWYKVSMILNEIWIISRENTIFAVQLNASEFTDWKHS